ncbi:MAG: NRDE family protein [Betaproteobacteria bacterium]|nr:MAG: NRDE family protein [Betaproteobacteria bacterium]
MCLIVFAWKSHPSYPLVLAANRDEFLDRPTRQLDYWEDLPSVLGGRDLEKGGSWFATHVDGRWAAVTNYRDGGTASSPPGLSRGHLVSNYVASGDQAQDYARHITQPLAEYPGCNLLVGDSQSLFFVSNRFQGERRAAAESVVSGVHGLSNHSLDTPWPKVQRAKRKMQQLIDNGSELHEDELFGLLADRTPAQDEELPSTGVPVEWERVLSPPFIVSDSYGTRASTVVLMGLDGAVSVHERSFGAGGVELERRSVNFKRR